MISGFFGEYRWLSNFHHCRVIDGLGWEWPTVEHAYQASKSVKSSYFLAIRDAKTPGEAKRLGRTAPMDVEWPAKKLNVMRELVYSKFSLLNRDLVKRLLDTGDQEIVENNHWRDTFWGVCRGVGHNHLGKIIMDVRRDLRSGLGPVVPTPVDNFREYRPAVERRSNP